MSTSSTRILDLDHPAVVALAEVVPAADTTTQALRNMHAVIASRVRPVYGVDDVQRVSQTISRGRGSCSQRMAVLEALARKADVATRVEGFAVDGSFWYSRFPHSRRLIPRQIILAWPQFLIDDTWVEISDALGLGVEREFCRFENVGETTLFAAIRDSPISWRPATDTACNDFSPYVRAELGVWPSRDALFTAHGQTYGRVRRLVIDPAMSRCSAGAAA